MKDLKRQDRNGTRTTSDIERKYKLGQIDYTAEEIEKLKMKLVVDSSLSASSPNAIANSAVTKALNTKVNKETGKGLSTNDFTDADKEKLDNIGDFAEVPTGGTTGQVLTKKSNEDNDTYWATPTGGSTGGVTGDTLPIGAVIEYDGDTVPSNWEEVEGATSKVLYKNATGTTGNVTLSETVANFDEIKICYERTTSAGVHYSKSITVDRPEGKKAVLDFARWTGTGGTMDIIQIASKIVSISGNSITIDGNRYANITSDMLINDFGTDNSIYITKVVGYKEV